MSNAGCDGKANVLGIAVDALDLPMAVSRALGKVRQSPGYVCLAGAHGIVEARRNSELAKAYQGASLILPDGMPTVWVGRQQGFENMDRVFGPEFMFALFAASQRSNLRHFLYGGKPGVAEELREVLEEQFPSAKIVGTFTPPFRDLTRSEQGELFARLEICQPDFMWVGLSTPKQEIFMHRYLGLLPAKVMIGVGAAFDFHTGRITDSPQWIKRCGLQWAHRLAQDPGRLWKRYLRTNTVFLALSVLQLLGSERVRALPYRKARTTSLERPMAK